MAEAFHGRIGAYEISIGAGNEQLAAALARNVYGRARAADAASLAGYVRAVDAELAAQPVARLLSGIVSFPGAVRR
jgi:hypothetical protein